MNKDGFILVCTVLIIAVIILIYLLTERKLNSIDEQLAVLQGHKQNAVSSSDNTGSDSISENKVKEPIGFKPSYMAKDMQS